MLDGQNSSKYVKLNTGWEIPLIGLGTYRITDQVTMDVAVEAALDSGYRHFDTAKIYNNEAFLGSALERLLPKFGLRREDIFMTTKFFPRPSTEEPNGVSRLINESLEKLKTKYIDLVLIHYPCPFTFPSGIPDSNHPQNGDAENNLDSRRDTWLQLENYFGDKVRSIGVSNYEVCHLDEMRSYTSKLPAVNQVEYHPHFRRPEIKEYCRKHSIFFQAFSSFARCHSDIIQDPVIDELAVKYQTSPQTILLSFSTSQGVGIIPKSTTPDRIRANYKSAELILDNVDIEKLNSINKNVPYMRPTPWLVK